MGLGTLSLDHKLLRASLLLGTLLALAGCWKEPRHVTWKNVPGPEQYEQLLWEAIRSHDWQQVEHHLAPMFIGVGSDGRHYDRAGWLEHWKGAQIQQATVADVTSLPNGADMVVSYELRLEGTLRGSPMESRALRVTSVWQELKKGWVLISQSCTPVLESNAAGPK